MNNIALYGLFTVDLGVFSLLASSVVFSVSSVKYLFLHELVNNCKVLYFTLIYCSVNFLV